MTNSKDANAQARLDGRTSIFNSAYNDIKTIIPFDAGWKNGTGYYDFAMTAELGITPGELAKSFDVETQRRLIFIGTRFGNVIIFERYRNGDQSVYVSNSTRNAQMAGSIEKGSLSAEALERHIGHVNDNTGTSIYNIGKTIEKIAAIFGV